MVPFRLAKMNVLAPLAPAPLLIVNAPGTPANSIPVGPCGPEPVVGRVTTRGLMLTCSDGPTLYRVETPAP